MYRSLAIVLVVCALLAKCQTDEGLNILRAGDTQSGLEKLDATNFDNSEGAFRKFFDDQIKAHLGMIANMSGQPAPNMDDFPGLLDEADKKMLARFHNIETTEDRVLLECPLDHLMNYRANEKTQDVPSWGSFMCALRLMVNDMLASMGMISPEVALNIVKSVHLANPEAAALIYTEKKLTGDFLILPVVLSNKVLRVATKMRFANKEATLLNEKTSSVMDELEPEGVTHMEIIALTIRRSVRYYEKLGMDAFCELKDKVFETMGPESLAGLAFADSDKHACFTGKSKSSKKKAGKWLRK